MLYIRGILSEIDECESNVSAADVRRDVKSQTIPQLLSMSRRERSGNLMAAAARRLIAHGGTWRFRVLTGNLHLLPRCFCVLTLFTPSN